MAEQEELHEGLSLRERAHKALEEYRQTSPDVPLGGLPIIEYEKLRRDTEAGEFTPDQLIQRGWLELEFVMTAMRGAINTETEEPYTQKDINVASDATRAYFRAVTRDESASPVLRAQARIAMASVPIHQDIVAGRVGGDLSKNQKPYMLGLQAASRELLEVTELTPQEQLAVDGIAIQYMLATYASVSGWYLPTAPRQPWHVTAHNVKRHVPDQHILVASEPQSEHPDGYNVVTRALLHHNAWPERGRFMTLTRLAELDIGAAVTAKAGSYSALPKDTRDRWRETFSTLGWITDEILRDISDFAEQQAERGIIPADEVTKETSRPQSEKREIFPEVIWYLAGFEGEPTHGQLTANVRRLEKRRTEEGLTPDEQRVLGWMQLKYAQVSALDAGNDESALEIARARFAVAADTFTRALRMFKRSKRPGDMYDALLAQEAAFVHRALYTNSDKYGVRRAVTQYVQNTAAGFKMAAREKPDDAQAPTLQHVINRANLALLQAVADEGLRHLILPASLRLGDTQDAMALLELYDGTSASSYDLAKPVHIAFTEGNEIEVSPMRIQIGRDMLVMPGEQNGLLIELRALVDRGGKPAKVAPQAVKARKKSKVVVAGASVKKQRSDLVVELSEKIAYAISDAYEAED